MQTLKFLAPFLVPVAVFFLLYDQETLLFASAILFVLFFPWLLVRLWACRPLADKELQERLERVCETGHFKHAGLLEWGVMKHRLTAAILGLLPAVRYVLFSQPILTNLSPNALSAVLAHEIGHTYRKHLLIYPFIFFGMLLFASTLADAAPFESELFRLALWIALATLYFRFVFGFFSRLFERQADLHGLHLGLPLAWMLEALESVALYSKEAFQLPNWHHYSLKERIEFLKKVEIDCTLALKHHQMTKKCVTLYFLLLAMICFLLYVVA